MGKSQLYFVDTCQNRPEIIKNFDSLVTTAVFDRSVSRILDNRAAPIFFATMEGALAYGQTGVGSNFNVVLLRGLANGAESVEDRAGRRVWPVSVLTLAAAMAQEFQKITTNQDVVLMGHVRDLAICYLDTPPTVDLTLSVMPDTRRDTARIKLNQVDGSRAFVWEQPDPAPPHPYAVRPSPPAGTHKVSAIVNASGNPIDLDERFINQRTRVWQVQLP
jgi:hypothetical protein